MKKFKVFLKYTLLLPLLLLVMIIAILFLWSVIPMISNPMRRPAPMIRNHILRHTPIGTCIEETIKVIEDNENWGTPTVNRSSGFTVEGIGIPDLPIFTVIGYKHIQSRPKIYNVILLHERSTRVFWGFDEGGKLIEVYVISSFAPRPA